MCFLEQTGGLAKMCPSIEGSLRELVQQVTFDENINRSSCENDRSVNNGVGGFSLSTQLKLGTKI